jgi:hypothetical protein
MRRPRHIGRETSRVCRCAGLFRKHRAATSWQLIGDTSAGNTLPRQTPATVPPGRPLERREPTAPAPQPRGGSRARGRWRPGSERWGSSPRRDSDRAARRFPASSLPIGRRRRLWSGRRRAAPRRRRRCLPRGRPAGTGGCSRDRGDLVEVIAVASHGRPGIGGRVRGCLKLQTVELLIGAFERPQCCGN